MSLTLFEGALGGIGLFLLGMRLMSEGVRTVADSRIRALFFAITANRVYSCLAGIFLALVVQSASAGIVFVFVLMRGGVLNPFQVLNVLGGVILGSSLVLQLNVSSYDVIAPLLIFAGVMLKFFARRRRLANSGDLLLGAGLLFLGLSQLEGSYRPINNHPLYELFDGVFDRTPFSAAVFGMTLSFLVQSAHTALTVVASLVPTSHLSLHMASYMTAGSLTGVSLAGALSAIGGGFAPRRVAAIVLLLSTLAGLVVALLGQYFPTLQLIQGSSTETLYHGFAMLHLYASILAAVSCSAISSYVSRWLVQTESAQASSTSISHTYAGYLDDRVLTTPAIALEQGRKEVHRMMRVTMFMYADIQAIISDFDARRAATIRQHEQVLDSLNHEITSFLVRLSQLVSDGAQQSEISRLLRIVSALEHVGDRSEEILESIIAKKEAGSLFSDEAMQAGTELAARIVDVLLLVEQAVLNGVCYSRDEIQGSKQVTRASFEQIKQQHFVRISSGVCTPQATMFFNDMTAAFMRIAEEGWSILESSPQKENE